MNKLKQMPKSQLLTAIEAEGPKSALMFSSIELATNLHDGQTRKDPVQGRVDTPYIEHCMRNVLRLIRFGCMDIDTLIAAALHDAVEDSAMAFAPRAVNTLEARALLRAHIAAEYGEAVAIIVDGVTNPYQAYSVRQMLTDAQKFAEYQAKVTAAISSSKAIYLVKLVDYIDNAGSLHHTPIVSITKAQRLATKYEPLVETFRTIGAGYAASCEDGIDWDAIDYALVRIGQRLRLIRGE